MIIPDVIDSSNFDKYFFDVRMNKPQKYQVIACYTAIAEFIKSPEKKQIIDLLRNTHKAEAVSQVMRKLLFASEVDSYKVPRMMAEDLLEGMSEDDVLEKPYKYKFERYYYTWEECVPENDPHWNIISILNHYSFDEKISTENGITMKSQFI